MVIQIMDALLAVIAGIGVCVLYYAGTNIILDRIFSEKNGLSLFVPAGFAHSYLTLDKENIIYYKLSEYYSPRSESGIIWNDKDLKIKWPINKPKISSKDKKLPTYNDFLKKFKYL